MKLRLLDRTGLDLKYLASDVDRHGNVRVYVRRGGHKVRIRALANVEEFTAAYRDALLGVAADTKSSKSEPFAPGSLGWLVQRYYASPEFARLHPTTRLKRRNILKGICAEHGTKPFARLETRHVALHIRNPKAATPEATNSLVKALRGVFAWASDPEVGIAKHNPARDVSLLKPNNPLGIHAWTEDEIQQYEVRHPNGTKARKALAILLYAAVRISDAAVLGRQNERLVDGLTRLVFTEEKNKQKKPKLRDILMLPALRAEIDASPSGHMTYLVTEHGAPYSVKGLGNRFKAWCRQAGLPHCSSHGLRKIGANRAYENGATEAEVMAIYAWDSPKQAALYTRKVNRKKLADRAIHLLDSGHNTNKSVPLSAEMEAGGTIRAKKA